MTGNTDSVYFTTHHPGPWYYGEAFQFEFNPHDVVQEYAIEWEPGIVRWFVADELIYVQDEPAADDLIYPMAIMMNCPTIFLPLILASGQATQPSRCLKALQPLFPSSFVKTSPSGTLFGLTMAFFLTGATQALLLTSFPVSSRTTNSDRR